MLRKILLLALILTPAMANAGGPIQKEDWPMFQQVVVDAGYQCKKTEGGHYLDTTYNGQLFRLYCNDNSLVYRIVVNQQRGRICVEPWDIANPQCDR